MQENSVSVQGLTVAYGGVQVIDRLNLDIRKGEFLVLLGSSGCGKSTLLNAIAGLQDTKGGQISIRGRDVTFLDPKDRGIGMVFQSYALYPRMTVRRNMSFGLSIRRVPAAEIERRISWAAELLHIEQLLDRKPADLSGGQRQRVAIGRALVREVDVFLFDEPLSNLDAQLRNELRVELKKLHQDLGNTMIYVTHDQVEAMTLADRIAIMKSGVIQQLASPAEIYSRPANLFVAGFIGSPKMNLIEGKVSGGRFEGGGVKIEAAALAALSADSVVLGLRPEHLRLAAPGEGAISATVEIVEDLGPEVIVWVRADGKQRLSLRVPPADVPAVGSTIDIAFDMSRACVFDGRSGDLIELATPDRPTLSN